MSISFSKSYSRFSSIRGYAYKVRFLGIEAISIATTTLTILMN